MPVSTTASTYDFLRGGGEMTNAIRRHHWSLSPLGAIEAWPANLRVALRLLLHSKLPMVLWWGDEHVHFYNDAYLTTLSDERHLRLLGTLGSRRTDDIWLAIKPAIDWVLAGKGAESGLDTPLPMPHQRREKVVYWDFEFLPVDGINGVDGVLAILKDVSADHFDDERLSEETANLLHLFEQTPGFICIFGGPTHIYKFVNEEYRKLMGLRNYIGGAVRDVVPEVEGQGFFELLDGVYATGETYIGKGIPMHFVPGGETIARDVSVDLVYKALRKSDGHVYGIFVEGTYEVGDIVATSIHRILTDREREVLGWIAVGKTASETAAILSISKRTCETHIYSAARKLDAANSTQTVVEAIKRGELTFSEGALTGGLMGGH